MNNYILEDNISFFDELKKEINEDSDLSNSCLISRMPLDNNKICLPCGHSFNLFPLYLEIVSQKSSYLYKGHKYINQIKCPYCRQFHDILLPHIKINSKMKFIAGVNTPEKYSMPFHKCNYQIKGGKNKGKVCNKSAFYKNEHCFCNLHHKYNHAKKTTLTTCKAILKTGKNKGSQCGNSIKDEGQEFCNVHNKNL